MPMPRGKRAGSKTPTVDYDAGCLVRSTSTKCPTKKFRTSSSPPISRPESAWASRPFPGDPQRAWQRRANPVRIALLHLVLESTRYGKGHHLHRVPPHAGVPRQAFVRERIRRQARPVQRLEFGREIERDL